MIICFTSNAQTIYSQLERKSFEFKNNNSDSFVYYKLEAIKEYTAQHKINDAARCFQSLGFYYKESESNSLKAFYYISCALENYGAIKDQSSIANLQKYLGILHSELGQFENGDRQIRESMRIYKKLGIQSGFHVACFDLGILKFNTATYDSCLYYLSKSKSYWLREQDSVRIFSINNWLLKCYDKLQRTDLYFRCKNENELLLEKNNIPEFLKNMYFDIINKGRL